MKKIFLFLLLLCLNLNVNSARSEDALLLKNLERPSVFRSRYIEEKHLPSLSAPLKSEGDFIYLKDRGIAWLMHSPFSMQTVITPRGLNQWVEGEKQSQSVETRKAMAPILKNISSIFSGDYETLNMQFDIKSYAEHQISLTPKSQYLKPHLQEIIITGIPIIEKIKIIYAPDKFTITTFNKPIIGMAGITDAEQVFFDE